MVMATRAATMWADLVGLSASLPIARMGCAVPHCPDLHRQRSSSTCSLLCAACISVAEMQKPPPGWAGVSG